MLNEAPGKQKKTIDYAHPTRAQLFWRIQRECWRRMITPYIMYFFMSIIMLAFQALGNMWAQIVVGSFCIAAGCFFNGHLLYHTGIEHYGAYVTGEHFRQREREGVNTGDHHPEREYRAWKGFYIGFLVGIPVIILGCLAGRFYDSLGGQVAQLALILLAGWAITPIAWIRNFAPGLANLSFYWSLLTVIVPVLVSGIFYIVGATHEKNKREQEYERAERERMEREEARNKPKEVHVQTEEQRKKTLQSKKKK